MQFQNQPLPKSIRRVLNWRIVVFVSLVLAATSAPMSLALEPAQTAALDLRFPWTAGQQWYMSRGWHGKGNNVDMAPDRNKVSEAGWVVLAAGSGVLQPACKDYPNGDGHTNNVSVVHDGGITTTYSHLDAKSVPTKLFGSRVPRGYPLGRLYNGRQGAAIIDKTDYQFRTPCGDGTGPHLHFSFSTRNVVIDGMNVAAFPTWGDNRATPPVTSSNVQPSPLSCNDMRRSGDANCDGKVDLSDLSMLAFYWGKELGQPGFDSRADFNQDGKIHIVDLSILALNWQRVVGGGVGYASLTAARSNHEGPTNAATEPVEVGFRQQRFDLAGTELVGVDVMLSGTPEQGFNGAEMFLRYSSKVLSFVDLKIADSEACRSLNRNGISLFTNEDLYKVSVDEETGLVKVVRSAKDTTSAILPTGRVCAATLWFEPKAPTPATAYITVSSLGENWKVTGNGQDYSLASTSASTVVVNIAGGADPVTPLSLSPAGGATLAGNQALTLYWDAADHADRYQVELLDSTGKLTVSDWLNAPSLAVETLSASSYRWRVKSGNWRGESIWSDYATFEIPAVPASPEPTPVVPTQPTQPARLGVYIPMAARN